MARADKRLREMERNPAAGWSIADIEAVCRRVGVDCTPPRGGGSHYTLSHPRMSMILTIPARRPVKPVYIRNFVAYVLHLTVSEDGR